ncbi:thrombomodulin-like [Oncorhynchus clarkii lewisi]|uniref:thrombomodulin-like n=1 Tax=Oncorhynchus clarkii lewisi TaxID=490388 RepID=UPI0039B89BDD
MRDTVGILVALTFLLRVKGEAPRGGYCIEKQCFAVFQDQVDFGTAQKHCEDNNGHNGHLMTVRSLISHSILLILLGIHTGNYWIGLQLPSGQCPDQALGLRGYRWITGDNETEFQNWGHFDDVCSSNCISVSKYDFEWKEQPCNSKIDGFICEYKLDSPCQHVMVKGDESVLYDNPLGFKGDNLLVLPLGTIATLKSLGSKYICHVEQWIQAPWNCDVFNGGCSHDCTSVNHEPVCTCPPGKTLQDNNVTCEFALNDPCHDSGCAHLCQKKDDSYACMCHHGYALAEDGKECKDIDYCVEDRQCPGQNSECVNRPTLGGFECRCQKGYELENDTCVDVDECFMGPCEHGCTNTIGSYICSCFDGFISMTEDANRCKLLCLAEECPTECDRSKTYQCYCPIGYLLDDRNGSSVCVDIDECEMDSYCHSNCTNTYGGYLCSCDEGFDLVGEYDCVERESSEGSGFTTPYIPSAKHPTERPFTVKAGGLLGMIVCIVVVILVMVVLIHLILKRRGNLDIAFESQGVGNHDLQQVSTDKYHKLSFDRHFII